MEHILVRLKQLEDVGEIDSALQLLAETKDNIEEDIKAHLQGRLYYKKQIWGKAINAFNSVPKESPLYPESQSFVNSIKGIIGFVNREMLDP